MSFPRYPEYKDSGVEWLGEVPVHWVVMPLKRDIEFVTSGARGWAENYADDGDLFLRIGNLTRDSIRLDLSDTQRVVVPDGAEVDRTQVKAGDILFSITAYLGSVAVVPVGLGRAFVSQHVALVRPSKKRCLSEWLAYVAISYVGKTHLETTGYGGTKVQLSLADVTSLPMVVPPIDEQAALIEFLDRETAKIDALVAEQEKLIALLQEKRQAVISHAVTKGLDPNVPMKDSGVEWLGEVPAHWEAVTLRRCAVAVQTGGTPSADALSESLDEGFVWFTPGDFGSSLKLSTSTRRIANEAVISGEVKVFPPNSVLIVSIGATLGKVGFAQDTSSANQQINAVIPNAKVDGYFLAWSLSVKTESMRFLSNASTIGIMNQEKTKEIWIALPPREKQMAISIFLDCETAKLDTLMTEARAAITLLQERRTALISAAVTGQIDVRGMFSKEVNA